MENFNKNLKDLLNVFTKRDNMQVENYKMQCPPTMHSGETLVL